LMLSGNSRGCCTQWRQAWAPALRSRGRVVIRGLGCSGAGFGKREGLFCVGFVVLLGSWLRVCFTLYHSCCCASGVCARHTGCKRLGCSLGAAGRSGALLGWHWGTNVSVFVGLGVGRISPCILERCAGVVVHHAGGLWALCALAFV
jgi:hypothetical protein